VEMGGRGPKEKGGGSMKRRTSKVLAGHDYLNIERLRFREKAFLIHRK